MTLRGNARTIVAELWSDGRGWILLAISVGQLLSLGVRLAFPAVLPQIKTEFLLTNTKAGILLSVLWVCFATAQLPGGVLTDRIGERNIIVASMAVSTIALGVIVLSPGLPLFVLGIALFGFGTGLYGTPRLTVLSDIYPERAATAISVSSALGNLGNATFPVVVTVIAGWFAWRTGIGIGLPGFVLLVVGLWLIIPERTSPQMQQKPDESRVQAASRIFDGVTRKPVLLATGAMICLGFVWQGFTAFLPTYLVEIKGIAQPVAATALGAFFVGGAVVQPITGSIADQYDERHILIAVAAATAIAFAAFPFVNSAPAFVALSVLASLQLAYWPIIFAYIPKALPDDVQGSGFGTLRTLFLYIGATGPVIVGALADRALFDESFLLLAGITGIALILSAGLPQIGDSNE